MALKIRLRRLGRKNAPHYRIVVAESSMPRDGRFVAHLGHYNPRTEPMTLVVNRSRALEWIAKGATPTDTVRSLLKRAGVFRPEPTVMETVTEAVTGAAATAAGAVSKAIDAVKHAAEDVVERAKDVAEDVVERVKDVAEDAAAVATEVAEDAAEPVAAEPAAAEEVEVAAEEEPVRG